METTAQRNTRFSWRPPLLMAEEAGHSFSLSTAPSPGSRAGGGTSYANVPASSGSYELHDILPGKATSVAASEPRPDDEHNPPVRPSKSPSPTAMSSRPLLLVRSSPAQGTGKKESFRHMTPLVGSNLKLVCSPRHTRIFISAYGMLLIVLRVLWRLANSVYES